MQELQNTNDILKQPYSSNTGLNILRVQGQQVAQHSDVNTENESESQNEPVIVDMALHGRHTKVPSNIANNAVPIYDPQKDARLDGFMSKERIQAFANNLNRARQAQDNKVQLADDLTDEVEERDVSDLSSSTDDGQREQPTIESERIQIDYDADGND